MNNENNFTISPVSHKPRFISLRSNTLKRSEMEIHDSNPNLLREDSCDPHSLKNFSTKEIDVYYGDNKFVSQKNTSNKKSKHSNFEKLTIKDNEFFSALNSRRLSAAKSTRELFPISQLFNVSLNQPNMSNDNSNASKQNQNCLINNNNIINKNPTICV